MAGEKEIFAPLAHKLLLATALTFFGVASLVGAWLWSLGSMSSLFCIAFGLASVFFGLRLRALNGNPVVTLDGPIVGILRWSGGYRKIDLRTAMDVAIGSEQIVVKQGRVGAGISKYAVGEERFDELVDIFKSRCGGFQKNS